MLRFLTLYDSPGARTRIRTGIVPLQPVLSSCGRHVLRCSFLVARVELQNMCCGEVIHVHLHLLPPRASKGVQALPRPSIGFEGLPKSSIQVIDARASRAFAASGSLSEASTGWKALEGFGRFAGFGRFFGRPWRALVVLGNPWKPWEALGARRWRAMEGLGRFCATHG